MSARPRNRARQASEGSRFECKYGSSCYRKNPEHFKEFRHSQHKKNKQRHDDHHQDEEQDQKQDQDREQPEEDKDEEVVEALSETSECATRILEKLSQCDVPVLVASWAAVRPALIHTILASTSIDLSPLATLIANYCEHSTTSCWRPVANKQANVPVTKSKIGGRPFLLPDEEWPCCSVCKSVMPLWLQLNMSELPLEAALELGLPHEMIQLFVCYTDKRCGTAAKQSDGTPTHLARKITWNTTQAQPIIGIPNLAGFRDGYDIPERVITGWNEIKDKVGLNDDWFPVCKSITLDDFAELDEDEHKPLEGDKLLGFPKFFNDAVYPSCPTCGVPPHERFTCRACGESVMMNHTWTCTHRACLDIHLCQSCYDQKAQPEEHQLTHPMTRHGRMRYIFQIDAEANNVITPFDLDGCWHIYQCAKHKNQLRACYVNC